MKIQRIQIHVIVRRALLFHVSEEPNRQMRLERDIKWIIKA